MKTLKILSLVTLTLALIGSAGYFGFASSSKPTPTTLPAPKTVAVTTCDVEQTVTAPGNLVNMDLAQVRMPATARLTHVGVQVGDGVLPGQTLAEVDDVAKAEARLKFIKAEDELKTAQKNRAAMDYPRATDAFLKEYKQKIKYQKQRIGLLSNAYENAIGPDAKAAALLELSNAQTELSTMNTNLNWYIGHPSEADIAAADSALEVAQAKFDMAKAVLDNLTITAPIGGIILESAAQTGVTFDAETILFKIGDPKALEVKINITEEDFPLIALGQEVKLFFDARSDVTVTGRVARIIPKRIEGSSPLYNIYISLDEVPDGLVDGMTTDAAVTIAKKAGVLCLPRAVVRASGENRVVLKVWNGVVTETREVTIGLRGDAFIEILAGLKEGDQVVTK